ncbi:hypothetical protein ACF3NA_08595 [Alkanindiges sp. WGS2144]|uniref:FFLEELY motif protein n=1 Tax=Alkanindiges sp. WGS2144 TaxID=3366808 RepID=UPI0037510FAD
MAKFDALQQQLVNFYNLEFHQNPTLAKRLNDVQTWQKERMKKTHREFFAVPEHHLMTQYFLNRLYGGPDFDVLAQQISRLIDHAGIVEKIIPDSAIRTGFAGVELAVLAVKLDQDLAIDLLNTYAPDMLLTDEIMRQAYLKLDQQAARLHQMDLLEELGIGLDKYVRSRLVKTAFKMSKGLAYKYKVAPIYDFIEEGFAAMQPLESAETFVKVFTTGERQIIARVHAGEPYPFA